MRPGVAEHLARAEGFLKAAGELLRLGFPSDCVSRAYYAMFHCATAILRELGIERSSHHATWAAFGQLVTAKGLMGVEHHHAGLRMFKARSRSDYLAQPDDTLVEAAEALGLARDFATASRECLSRLAPPHES